MKKFFFNVLLCIFLTSMSYASQNIPEIDQYHWLIPRTHILSYLNDFKKIQLQQLDKQFYHNIIPQAVKSLVNKRLEKSIDGYRPFYAITFTRNLNNDRNTDYCIITPTQRFVCLSLLSSYLGEKIKDEDFSRNLKEKINNEYTSCAYIKHVQKSLLQLYQSKKLKNISNYETHKESLYFLLFNGNVTARFDELEEMEREIDTYMHNTLFSFVVSDKYADLKKEPRFKLSEFGQNNKQGAKIILDEVSKEAKKIFASLQKSNPYVDSSLTPEELRIKDFWANPKTSKESLKKEYCDFFQKNKAQTREERLYQGNGIVVFNEMFFGKYPLSDDILYSEIKQLSMRHPLKILHVNLLTSYQRDSTEFASLQEQENWINYNTLTEEKVARGFFDYQYEKSYDDYIVHIKYKGFPLNILENETSSWLNGNKLTYYNKATYNREFDKELMEKPYFYTFGSGEDKPVFNFSGDKVIEKQSTILLDRISTEICYDLNRSVRKSINHYPRNSRIHVIQSNTLNFDEKIKYDANEINKDQLPHNISPLVIQSDPIKSAIFKKKKVQRSGGIIGIYEEIGDGMCEDFEQIPSILPFQLDESTYTIKCWDLSKLK